MNWPRWSTVVPRVRNSGICSKRGGELNLEVRFRPPVRAIRYRFTVFRRKPIGGACLVFYSVPINRHLRSRHVKPRLCLPDHCFERSSSHRLHADVTTHRVSDEPGRR
jgi:hypothetical protein